jgi:RimJ/RimL family protein N-acetyltransferase
VTAPLETPRLVLSPCSLELAEALLADPEAWPDDELRGLLELYLGWLRDDESVLGFGPWIVTTRDGSDVVGSAGFLGPPNDASEVELGYGIVEQHRGRGYATEATTALVAWALVQPGVDRVAARLSVDNEPSTRVLEKTGFARSGPAGELVRWVHE